MAEYIEREAALEAQNKSMNLAECRKRLIRLPAADVRPVVRGMWVWDDRTGDYYCSECGKSTTDRHDEVKEFDGRRVIALCMPHFCGNCGADMREPPKEET